MLEYLFGNKTVEKILFYLLLNEKCYATQLKKRLKAPLNGIQQALLKLEGGGILVSFTEGKTRLFQYNPRYPFLKELTAFFQKAYEFLPEKTKKEFYEQIERRRPRKTGKPL